MKLGRNNNPNAYFYAHIVYSRESVGLFLHPLAVICEN